MFCFRIILRITREAPHMPWRDRKSIGEPSSYFSIAMWYSFSSCGFCPRGQKEAQGQNKGLKKGLENSQVLFS